MATRDLDRLAQRVRAHRMELYPSRLAAARAAGISKDTWKRVETGQLVQEAKYVQIDRALGWATGSCVLVAEGGEPVLGDQANAGAPAAQLTSFSAEDVRKAVFEAARSKLPMAPIGDLDDYADELVEVLRRIGAVYESGGD